MPAKNKNPNSLYISRLYDAPIQAVWDAWTDPQQAAQWWGPRGFTITTHSKDLRVGGTWHYTMHGPDGVDYVNKTKYLEVEPLRKLVYDHGGNDDRAPLFRVTVTFQEVKGKTQMDMTMTLPNPEAAEETRKFVKKAGGNATWDRLGEYLAKESSGREQFIINRSFPVSIDKMYQLWTDPEHLARWLPPTGSTMQFIQQDVRPGGTSFYSYSMIHGTDAPLYGRVHYMEMHKPNRIIYTQQFADKHGNLARHPMAPTWPATLLTVVSFTSEGANETRVTVTWEPQGEVTAQELATFVAGRTGMTLGWTGSFDKLEEILT